MKNAYALVIGIAHYHHINPLPETVQKDAQDIYNLLIDPSYCGYGADNVTLLVDAQATRTAIQQTLTHLAQQSNEDSTIFIYISSHGGRIKSGTNAGEYLLPVDTNIYMDENNQWQLCVETVISNADFTKAMEAIKARKLIIIFDCCHAAGIAKEGIVKDIKELSLKKGFSDNYYNELMKGKGWVILASSRNTEKSYIINGDRNSLFTKHLLAGLRGGIPSEDGVIRVFELFEYLQPRVTSEKSIQHPIFKSELEENFAISLYVGGQKGTVNKDEEGFRYDAYISYVRKEPDAGWVWETLVPRLKEANLRVAVSGMAEDPGVALIVGIERAIEQSRRTVVVLSKSYLDSNWAQFRDTLAQMLGVEERQARLLPVIIDKELVDEEGHIAEPATSRLRMLTPLDLTDPYVGQENFDRLVQILGGSLVRG